MKKYLDFSQEFGKVDERTDSRSRKPWTIKRGDISGCTGEKSVRQQQSFWRDPCYNRWYPHVRRYFRHHSCCRGTTF